MVTDAMRANARPSSVAPLARVMDSFAIDIALRVESDRAGEGQSAGGFIEPGSKGASTEVSISHVNRCESASGSIVVSRGQITLGNTDVTGDLGVWAGASVTGIQGIV